MKTAFIPATLGGKLNWLDEECAELGQAIAKTQRFREEQGLTLVDALHLYDPTIAHEKRETNHAWILREMADLKAAIALFEAVAIPCCEGTLACGFLPRDTFTCYRCKKLRCFCMGADGHEDCADCWSARQKKPTTPKKPHAKKQSQQAQPKSQKKVRSKKTRKHSRAIPKRSLGSDYA